MATIALNGSSLNCSMGIGYYTDLNSSFSRSKSSAKSLSDAFASLKQKIDSKSDNMDEVAKTIYRLNISSNIDCDGYILAKALTQVNDADDSDTEILSSAYNVLLEYSEKEEYRKIVAKIAIKLMSGRKTDTVASSLGVERETVQNLLAPLTKIGGD